MLPAVRSNRTSEAGNGADASSAGAGQHGTRMPSLATPTSRDKDGSGFGAKKRVAKASPRKNGRLARHHTVDTSSLAQTAPSIVPQSQSTGQHSGGSGQRKPKASKASSPRLPSYTSAEVPRRPKKHYQKGTRGLARNYTRAWVSSAAATQDDSTTDGWTEQQEQPDGDDADLFQRRRRPHLPGHSGARVQPGGAANDRRSRHERSKSHQPDVTPDLRPYKHGPGSQRKQEDTGKPSKSPRSAKHSNSKQGRYEDEEAGDDKHRNSRRRKKERKEKKDRKRSPRRYMTAAPAPAPAEVKPQVPSHIVPRQGKGSHGRSSRVATSTVPAPSANVGSRKPGKMQRQPTSMKVVTVNAPGTSMHGTKKIIYYYDTKPKSRSRSRASSKPDSVDGRPALSWEEELNIAQRYNVAATTIQRVYRGHDARSTVEELRKSPQRQQRQQRQAARAADANAMLPTVRGATTAQTPVKPTEAAAGPSPVKFPSLAPGSEPAPAHQSPKASKSKKQRNAEAQREYRAAKEEARRKRQAERAEMKAARRHAATKIQAAHRGRAVREQRKQEAQAAVKLQAVSRGAAVRKQARREAEAAQSLQAVGRGFNARKRAERLRLEREVAEATAAAEAQAAEEEAAARKIQKTIRVNGPDLKQRRELRRHESARRIQALARGRSSRKQVAQIKRQRSDAEAFIHSVQRRNGIGTSIRAAAMSMRSVLNYDDEVAVAVASALDRARIDMIANVTQDDLHAFFANIASPGRIVVVLAAAVCTVFAQPASWESALRVLLAPDFYEAAMAITPDLLPESNRQTLRKLITSNNVLETAKLTENEILRCLSRWLAALAGLLHKGTRPRSALSDALQTQPPSHRGSVAAAPRNSVAARSEASDSSEYKRHEVEERVVDHFATKGASTTVKAAAASFFQGSSRRLKHVDDAEMKETYTLEELEVDLTELNAARKAVKSLSKSHLRKVYDTMHPSTPMAVVAAAICVLLNQQPTWQQACATLRNPQTKQVIFNMQPTELTNRQLTITENLTKQHSLENLGTAHKVRALRVMARWVLAIMKAADDFRTKTKLRQRTHVKQMEAQEELKKALARVDSDSSDDVAELKAALAPKRPTGSKKSKPAPGRARKRVASDAAPAPAPAPAPAAAAPAPAPAPAAAAPAPAPAPAAPAPAPAPAPAAAAAAAPAPAAPAPAPAPAAAAPAPAPASAAAAPAPAPAAAAAAPTKRTAPAQTSTLAATATLRSSAAASKGKPAASSDVSPALLKAVRDHARQHVTPAVLALITTVTTPNKPLALLSGIVCVCLGVSPASWAGAKSAFKKPDFLERCVTLEPSSITPQQLGIVTQLYSVHRLWDLILHNSDLEGPKAIESMVQLFGVICGIPRVTVAAKTTFGL